MKRLVLILTATLMGPGMISAATPAPDGSSNISTTPGLVWTPSFLPQPVDGSILANGVSMSGDLLLIGTPTRRSPDGITSAGGAHIYRKIDNAWTEQQVLLPSQPREFGTFGSVLALRGSIAIIGEPGWLSPGSTRAPGPEEGQWSVAPLAVHTPHAAYIYEEQGGVWSETARLVADDGGAGAPPGITTGTTFATSVALDGRTAAVGAWGHTDNADRLEHGAVYIFSDDGHGWRQTQKLMANDARSRDHFGFSVALQGDTLLIGARDATRDRNRPSQGLVFVFERIGGVWTETQMLHPPTLAEGMQFGNSIALDGDTAIVGAPHLGLTTETTKPDWGHGAVYALARTNGIWRVTQELGLHAVDGFFDTLGTWVGLSGDYAVASANQKVYTDGLVQAGAAYVFERVGERWAQQAMLTAPNSQDSLRFGSHVTIADRTVMAPGGLEFESHRPATAQFVPASVHAAAGPGQIVQGALRIDNPGDMALDFDLAAGATGAVVLKAPAAPRPQPWPSDLAIGTDPAVRSTGAPIQVGAASATGAPLDFVLDHGSYDQLVTLGVKEEATIWLNRFAAPPGTGAFTLDSLSILFPAAQFGTLIGSEINLVAYYDADADGDPGNAQRLGGDRFVTISAQDQFISFATDFRVPGDGDIYVGFVTSYARGGWPKMYIAALDASVPQFKSSWFGFMRGGIAPDLENLSANAVQGFMEDYSRGGNWLIRATGVDPADDCIAPSAVPWLAVSPASGSVPAGGSAVVTLTLNASGLAEGSYTAQLCAPTNDPSRAMVRVPVTLTVLPDGTLFRDGFEGTP